MATANQNGVNAVTGMLLVILSVAMLVPAVVVTLESPQDITLNQEEQERLVLSGTISTTANDIIDGGNPSANFTVVNERTGEVRTTGELGEGESATLQFPNGNITITDIDVVNDNTVIVRYEYPTYIGFPANAEVIFKNLPLFIVIFTILLLIGVLITISEVFS